MHILKSIGERQISEEVVEMNGLWQFLDGYLTLPVTYNIFIRGS